MPAATRFRDAASVLVDVPPERVHDLLSRTEILRAIDERLVDSNLEIVRAGEQVEVRDLEGRVHVGFRLKEAEGGTRVAALEEVRPEGAWETTKRMLFPGRAHEDLERELERLRVLLEAVDAGQS